MASGSWDLSPPRVMPVSSRTRHQKSPIDPRYKDLQRTPSRMTRSTHPRMRNAAERTVNYSELSEDEGKTEQTYDNAHLFSNDLISQCDTVSTRKSKLKFQASSTKEDHNVKASSLSPLFNSTNTPEVHRRSRSICKLGNGVLRYSGRSFGNASVTDADGGDDDDSDDDQEISLTSKTAQIGSAGARIFTKLATEVLQHIASYLPTDRDVFNYKLSCRSVFSSITASVWRHRFNQKYDPSPGLDTDDTAQKYHERRLVASTFTVFDLRMRGRYIDRGVQSQLVCAQENALKLLRALLVESKNYRVVDNKGASSIQGKNLQIIMDLISSPDLNSNHNPAQRPYFDIVDAIFCTSKDSNINSFLNRNQIVHAHSQGAFVYMIQICLAPYYLGPSKKYRQRYFDVSQYQTYSIHQPLFVGAYKEVINVRLLLHMLNFFQFHLKAKGEGLLASSYHSLRSDQVPRPWVGEIKTGTQPLGRHWKGVYTYLDQRVLSKYRAWDGVGNFFAIDHLELAEAFQDISFFFNDDHVCKRPWPEKWETSLCSDTFKGYASPTKSATGKRKDIPQLEVKDFWGTSRRGHKAGKNGHFFGQLQAMPPQRGIHGFQRIIFMKFDAYELNDVDTYDTNNVWAYEGCVFPGGNLMAGRWWNPRLAWNDINNFSGPFLWWDVDTPTTKMPIQPEEALEFLESYFDQIIGLE